MTCGSGRFFWELINKPGTQNPPWKVKCKSKLRGVTWVLLLLLMNPEKPFERKPFFAWGNKTPKCHDILWTFVFYGQASPCNIYNLHFWPFQHSWPPNCNHFWMVLTTKKSGDVPSDLRSCFCFLPFWAIFRNPTLPKTNSQRPTPPENWVCSKNASIFQGLCVGFTYCNWDDINALLSYHSLRFPKKPYSSQLPLFRNFF